MSTWTIAQYTNEDLSATINTALDIYLDKLEKDGIINEAEKEVMQHYKIIVHKKGFWGKVLSRLFKEYEEGDDISYVRVVKV